MGTLVAGFITACVIALAVLGIYSNRKKRKGCGECREECLRDPRHSRQE